MVDSENIMANPTAIEEEYRDHIERGRLLYRDVVLPKLKKTGQANRGSFVVIDVPSGDYEVDTDDSLADFRLRLRCPNAFTWKERIGYNAPHALGGGLSLDDDFKD